MTCNYKFSFKRNVNHRIFPVSKEEDIFKSYLKDNDSKGIFISFTSDFNSLNHSFFNNLPNVFPGLKMLYPVNVVSNLGSKKASNANFFNLTENELILIKNYDEKLLKVPFKLFSDKFEENLVEWLTLYVKPCVEYLKESTFSNIVSTQLPIAVFLFNNDTLMNPREVEQVSLLYEYFDEQAVKYRVK